MKLCDIVISKNLDYAGVVPFGGEYSSLQRVIIKWYTGVEEPNGHYEGCSNMNASSFITFVTYMLLQNGICFYKGFYVTFKLAPGLKKYAIYLSSYSPLNQGHFSILTNSMLRNYQ